MLGKPMSSEDYAQIQGVRCPVCRGDRLHTGDVTCNEGMVYQNVTCMYEGCKSTWVDHYQLVGYGELNE